jgi:DNA-binding NarL/FixJ family response regulator
VAITLLLAMTNKAYIELFTDYIAPRINAKVIGSCSPFDEAWACYLSLQPDILLIDIKRGPPDNYSILQSVLKMNPQAKIIGITADFHPQVKENLQQIGARGYLLRNDNIGAIEKIINSVYNGGTLFAEAPLVLNTSFQDNGIVEIED